MNVLLRYLPLALLAVAWELAARLGLVSQLALPPLSQVALAWMQMLQSGELVANAASSLWRAGAGLALAIAVGAALGIAMATMTAIAICHFTSSAAGICWQPNCGAPTSMPRQVLARRLRGWCRRSARGGPRCRFGFVLTAGLHVRN